MTANAAVAGVQASCVRDCVFHAVWPLCVGRLGRQSPAAGRCFMFPLKLSVGVGLGISRSSLATCFKLPDTTGRTPLLILPYCSLRKR